MKSARRCWGLALTLLLASGFLLASGPARAQLLERVRMGPSISLDLGILAPSDSDLMDTYGILPAVGARASLNLDKALEFYIGASYTRKSGDPYYDDGTFAGPKARLTAVPIRFGLRHDLLDTPGRALFIGTEIHYLWVKERVPGTASADQPRSPEYDGWGWGWQITAGPEWEAKADRVAFGIEVALGRNNVRVEHFDAFQRRRDVDLSAFSSRGYVTLFF